MDVLHGYNLTRFLTFVPKIRKNIEDWRILDISLTGKTHHNTALIAMKLKEHFKGLEGIIFICNSKEILVIVCTGKEANSAVLSENIDKAMPKYSCNAYAQNVTADGLLKIQIRLQDQEISDESSLLLKTREIRSERIIMVVDDDMFMRSLVVKTFQPKGKVLEFEDTTNIVETYLEQLPDIVFLDIHLPSGSGINILKEILAFDDSAYIIILSVDSVKENVLSAQKIGARGFVAKPFTQEKLLACYNKCPTVNSGV